MWPQASCPNEDDPLAVSPSGRVAARRSRAEDGAADLAAERIEGVRVDVAPPERREGAVTDHEPAADRRAPSRRFGYSSTGGVWLGTGQPV